MRKIFHIIRVLLNIDKSRDNYTTIFCIYNKMEYLYHVIKNKQ